MEPWITNPVSSLILDEICEHLPGNANKAYGRSKEFTDADERCDYRQKAKVMRRVLYSSAQYKERANFFIALKSFID